MRIAVAGGTGIVGRAVVDALDRSGHASVVLARSTGVDLRHDALVAEGLSDVDVIIDVTNAPSTRRARATGFFTEVTGRLQRIGANEGVARLVTLSIVGIDRGSPSGYYRAKLAQEAEARRGPVPVTIVRATQFHEFAAQVLARTRWGPVAVVPRMLVQPVAARALAEVLVATATGAPSEEMFEVAGPESASLVDLARLLVGHRGRRVRVVGVGMPGASGRAMRAGGLLPSPGARIVGPRFEAWLESEDAAFPPF